MEPETSAIDGQAKSENSSAESTSSNTTLDDNLASKSRKRKRSQTASRRPDSSEIDGQVVRLETQLREKEQLVVALTERLEQAAEQLDRFRRTGSDRGLRVGGGIPAELVESQTSLVEKLQHALEQWENLQAATALGRLEVQVSELRELVASRVLAGRPSDALLDGNSASPSVARTTECDSSDDHQDTGDGASGWEKLKAEILARDSIADSSRDERTAAQTEPSTNEVASRQGLAERFDEEIPTAAASQDEDQGGCEISSIRPPEPIAFDTADLQQLRMAIESRDAYISRLLKKLSENNAVEMPTDWQALQSLPEALQTRVQQLAEQLKEKLRFAAVDFSLERARLGRKEARLQQREEQLNAKIQHLGLDLATADSSDLPRDDETKGKRRWLRFLTRGDTDEKAPEADS